MREVIGFEYICEILSIITSNPEKKEKYKALSRSGQSFANGDKDVLVHDWSVLAKQVIDNDSDKIKNLLDYYLRISADDKSEFMSKYIEDVKIYNRSGGRTALANAFNNILVNGRGAVPYFFWGISMTIVLAAGNYHDDVFYIGMEETKEILFKTMELFGYENISCIPDDSFLDEENLKKLLLFSLFHSFMVAFPYHRNHKDGNYETGRKLIRQVVDSNSESGLFHAIKNASEAGQIIDLLWNAQDKKCQYSDDFEWGQLNLEQFYTVPSVKGRDGFGLLSCDSHFRIRAFVEGKSGSGKSCMAKAVTLLCRNKVADLELVTKLKAELGLKGHNYLPVILECQDLLLADIKEHSLIECAMNQMYSNALSVFAENISYRAILRHYRECQEYVLKYVERKAIGEELLLIVDDFSKLGKEIVGIFMSKLDVLCRHYPNLHIILLANRLKPSERRRFTGYNSYKLINGEYGLDLFEKIKDFIPDQSITFEAIKADKVSTVFIDTPRRFCRFVNSSLDKSVFSIISEEIDMEIERKCAYEIDSQSCKEFLKHLAYETLNRRGNSRDCPIIPGNMINSRLLKQMPMGEENAMLIWEIIQKKLVLVEQSSSVNSYEFNNILFFEDLLVDYLIEFLENESGIECYGLMMNVLSKLSALEFSHVILNIVNRISNYDRYMSTDISEDNLNILIKTIAGIVFSFEEYEEKEACLWALNKIVTNDDLLDSFVRNGKYESRVRMIKIMDNLILALENKK